VTAWCSHVFRLNSVSGNGASAVVKTSVGSRLISRTRDITRTWNPRQSSREARSVQLIPAFNFCNKIPVFLHKFFPLCTAVSLSGRTINLLCSQCCVSRLVFTMLRQTRTGRSTAVRVALVQCSVDHHLGLVTGADRHSGCAPGCRCIAAASTDNG